MWQLRDEVRRTVNPPRGALHNWRLLVTPLKDVASGRVGGGGGEIQGGTAELASSSQTRRRRIGARFRRTTKVRKKRVRWLDCEAAEERHKSLECSCRQLHEALAWKHFQVQQLHRPCEGKIRENYSKFRSAWSRWQTCVSRSCLLTGVFGPVCLDSLNPTIPETV